MEISIESILTTSTEVELRESPVELNDALREVHGGRSGDFSLAAPLRVLLRYMRSHNDLIFDGILDGTVDAECSRCLERYPITVERPFFCTLLPVQTEIPNSRELELQQEDLSTSYYTGETINVSSLVSEQLLLSLPTLPLCKADCEGLCKRCGENLNTATCDCPSDSTNDHLFPLGSLSGLRISAPKKPHDDNRRS